MHEEGSPAKASREPRAYKEQLETLVAQRGTVPSHRLEETKRRHKAQKAVLAAIAAEPRTVPEIAEATGLPTQEVFWWITALRKYGKVQDEGKRGDYVAYRKK